MFLTNMLGAGFFKTLALIFNYVGGIIIGVFKFLLFMPMYLIFAGIMLIATFAEMTFKKLAGIDTIYLNGEAFGGGSGDGKDLVYAFITDSAVQDVFWSIVGLSIVLLFIFTIVAMIKSEFTIDLKGSAKGPIISRALKSLVNLLVIPVVTLISIFATNFLTKTIYDLFTPEGTSVVTKCFHVGAYNANRARCDRLFPTVLRKTGLIATGNPFAGISNDDDMANAIDDYFMKYQDVDIVYQNYSFISLLEAVDDGELTEGSIDALFFGFPENQKFFTLFRMAQVNIYYNMAKFDWILAIGSGIVIAWTLLSVCLVLVKRVFELCILFLLAPPMIAIAPLDGGAAEKKWRNEFMKRLLAVVAPIFAYNMYFLLVPLFENISLFAGVKMAVGATTAVGGVSMLGSYQLAITDYLFVFNIFFQLICVIVGLGILKSASALLSNLLGVEDLVKSGGEAAKKAVDVGKKAALGATAIGGVAIKGAAAAAKGFKGMGNRMANAQKSKLARQAAEGNDKAKAKLDKINAKDKKREERKEKFKEFGDKAKEKFKPVTEFAGKVKTGAKNFLSDAGIIAPDTSKEVAAIDEELYGKKDKDGNLISEGLAGDQRMAQNALSAAEEKLNNFSGDKNSAEYKSLVDEKNAAFQKHKEISASVAAKTAERSDAVQRGQSPWKAAFESEFGENAIDTSFGAKLTNSKLFKGKFGKTLFGKSMAEWLNPDGPQAKRRLNDALAGMFGDGGGGDLWKIWFNKNARAALYEGVPESKMRSANIEQELSWKARDRYYDKKAEQDERKKEERLIRRMLATQRGLNTDLYKQLDNEKNPTQIKKLEAEIEKMEISQGLHTEAKEFYDGAKGGSAKAKALEGFKEQMKDDATRRALDSDRAEKQRLDRILEERGEKRDEKIGNMTMEQILAAMAKFFGEKGLKTVEGSKTGIDPTKNQVKIEKPSLQGLLNGVTSMSDSLRDFISDLKEMLGDAKDSSGGSGKKD